MSKLVFTVRSESSGEIYALEAERTAGGVRFACTCQAGQNGTHCKHRVALLLGDPAAVIDVDETALASLQEMAGSSPILPALGDVEKAEKAVAAAQRDLKNAKKALARAMMG